MKSFKIYFVELDALEIHNVFSPGFKRGIVGWDNKTMKQRQEAEKILVNNRNKEDQFYKRLEQSILEKGIRTDTG